MRWLRIKPAVNASLGGNRLRAGLALGLLLAFSALLLVNYALPRERSFLVESETFGAEIVSDGFERGNWWIDELNERDERNERKKGALICEIRDEIEPDADPGSYPDCHAGIYEVKPAKGPLSFRFPEGTRVQLESGRTGALVAEILELGEGQQHLVLGDGDGDGGGEVEVGSRLVIPWEVFAASGSLPFSARSLTIGNRVDEGERRILRSGRYSIRERLGIIRIIQELSGISVWEPRDPISVVSGNFYLGDSVSFDFEEGQGSVFGFVTAAMREDLTTVPSFFPFKVVAYTELSDREMLIERFLSNPREIAPTWTDRAISDPWPLAVTIVLTLLALCVSILADLASLVRPEDQGKGPARRNRETEPDGQGSGTKGAKVTLATEQSDEVSAGAKQSAVQDTDERLPKKFDSE